MVKTYIVPYCSRDYPPHFGVGNTGVIEE